MTQYVIRYREPETNELLTYEVEGEYNDAFDLGYSLADKGWFRVEHRGEPPIMKFDGKYQFLSNFWLTPVIYDGVLYRSVEHAYQAAKTFDIRHRMMISNAPTPGRAKLVGRHVPMRLDWEEQKVPVMALLLLQKFKRGTHLAQLLDLTGERELIEGNTWGDDFWGSDTRRPWPGMNMLGRLLMKIREMNREL